MTPQEEIQFIVENTDGECWHEWISARSTGNALYDLNHNVCKCGLVAVIGVPNIEHNPSPHDLNELARLMNKMPEFARSNYDLTITKEDGAFDCTLVTNKMIPHNAFYSTLSSFFLQVQAALQKHQDLQL